MNDREALSKPYRTDQRIDRLSAQRVVCRFPAFQAQNVFILPRRTRWLLHEVNSSMSWRKMMTSEGGKPKECG
jgi:hypothetical protein